MHRNKTTGVSETHEQIAALEGGSSSLRTVVVHYHLFKNAGTSVDEVLKRNFGVRFTIKEFSASGRSSASIAEYLQRRPALLALSSHTAVLPAARSDNLSIFPILFLRHPIDRLRSAYDFERAQRADTAGANLAKTHDFAGYLRALLARPRSQARNFQARRLAFNEPARSGTQLKRALRTIGTLPFIGLVECYEQSIEVLEGRLKPYFPGFKAFNARKNISQRSYDGLTARMKALKSEIGSELYATTVAANAEDMQIFAQMAARYNLHL